MTLMIPAAADAFRADLLFRPTSVAVIGAGSPEGRQVMQNLMAADFAGAILPVAAGVPAVCGALAYADVAALPVAPDLAVIASPGHEVETVMQALAARGTRAAIVTGMAPDLARVSAQTGVRVLGPGSFGVSVPGIGLNASRAHLVPRAGRLALISQSAALCRAVLDWAEPNGVGFSHIVGIGGNAGIGFGLVLDWLARDPGTGAILLDIRRLKDARAFLSAARAAAWQRPTVAIRAGGRLLDASGRADRVLEAALRRAGVLSVTTLEDFLAAAETLTRARPPRGDGLVIVTNAVGPAQLAADAALRDGLTLAALTGQTREVLAMSLPADYIRPQAGADFPAGSESGFVYVGPDSPMRLAEVAALLAGAPEVGGVLIVHTPAGEVDAAGIEAITACASTIRVPLLVCAMGETTAAPHRRRLAEAGVPVFATPEQAVRGFLHLVQNRRNRAAARELPPRAVLSLAPDRDDVARLFARLRRGGRLELTQDEALQVLAAYGVPIVPTRAAEGAEDAGAAAELLGFPSVVKLRRHSRPDAGGVGGVALDLDDAREVTLAARMIEARRARHAPDAPAPGFVVQRRAGRARELLVRVADDAVFGPAIGFGQGGSAADVLADVALDLPPLNLPLAHALIRRTRVSGTLARFHDQAAANVDAVADALVRISQLIVDFPEIAELDLNPLFADADGVAAADAWIRLRPAGEPGPSLAITPYPADLAESWSAGGETLTIRPIRPEDAEAHIAFFGRLTPEDVRYRFFTTLRELAPEQIARMTQVDYLREIAFVATREGTAERPGETVGVARLVNEPGTGRGEFAVIVEPSMKGKGLARRLMEKIIEWGRAGGLAEIVGQVLAENAPMLSFIRRLGFSIHRVPGEDDVVEARLVLRPEAAGEGPAGPV